MPWTRRLLRLRADSVLVAVCLGDWRAKRANDWADMEEDQRLQARRSRYISESNAPARSSWDRWSSRRVEHPADLAGSAKIAA